VADDRRAPVTRWALICWEPQNAAQIAAIRLVAEARVKVWTDRGWHVLGQDSEIPYRGREGESWRG
jgi:hypothetical protein